MPWYCKPGQNPVVEEGIGPSTEDTTVVLVNRHVCLSSCLLSVSVLFLWTNPPAVFYDQRSFFLQWETANTDSLAVRVLRTIDC